MKSAVMMAGFQRGLSLFWQVFPATKHKKATVGHFLDDVYVYIR